MDDHYIARMKRRLVNMRKVASLAHNPEIIELVTRTANELEEDILQLEAERSDMIIIHLEPPPAQ
jgi:hypothetical protein